MKVFNIDRETETGLQRYFEAMQVDSPLFQEVEREFNKWIEDSNPAMEYEEMYFGDDAIYDKRNAIKAGIEHIFEVMDEEDLPYILTTDSRIDFDAIFS